MTIPKPSWKESATSHFEKPLCGVHVQDPSMDFGVGG